MLAANRSSEPASRLQLVSRIAGLSAFILVLAWQLLSLWRTTFPSPPSRITFEAIFPRGIGGQCEPIVTTGVTGASDLLAVRYLDENNAVFVYDVWGLGGPTSQPFPLRPGERRILEIEMPSLAHVTTAAPGEKRLLHVAVDRQVLLDESTHFYRRRAADVYFARNPAGGTVATREFRGQLMLPGGRILRGGPECFFGGSERAGLILKTHAGSLAVRILSSAAIGWLVAWLVTWPAWSRLLSRWTRPSSPVFPVHNRPPHRWFVASAAVCALAFSAMVSSGTFRLIAEDSFATFYDHQAAAWLKGRWDVPGEALSGESFIVDGKVYGYFGPTPALLRLPFVVSGIAFGKLTRLYMVAYHIAILAAAYALLVHVARLGTKIASWPAPTSVVVFTTIAGMGTSLFFLSSRAYVYHEAILCGGTFALWSGYFCLRFMAEPRRAWWAAAIACGLLAIHARPPSGLFALCLAGSASLFVAWQNFRAQRRLAAVGRPFLIGAAAAAGILSFNGVSYLKFKSFEGAPLRYHVQYPPARLANIEGKNFHSTNLGFNFATYFGKPNVVLRENFPYVYITGPDPQAYPTAKMDLAEPTGSVPFTMPALFLLATLGGLFAGAVWSAARAPLGAVVAGAAPMTLALFTAVAVSHRYTADFCPALLLLGAFGLNAIQPLAARWRKAVRVTLGLVTFASVLITLSTTLHYQGEMVWGVPDDVRARYRTLRKNVDNFFGIRNPELNP